jgi:exopolysaccharide biosynthesis polyprenyl glycosylphosphotransferase
MLDHAPPDATPRWRRSSGAATADYLAMPTPIALQRMARPRVRRHVRRSLLRLSVLVAADLSTLFAIRMLMRGLRDHGWLGHRLAGLFGELVPHGTYPPLQLVVATVLGLAVFGNYASGDSRRNPMRLTAGASLAFALLFWGRVWQSFHPAAILGFALTLVAGASALVLMRLTVDIVVRRVRPVGRARTLFVSAPGQGEADVHSPLFQNNGELEIVGYLSTGVTREPRAVGHLDEIVRVIRDHSVDSLIISGKVDQDAFEAVVDAGTLAGCEVFAAPRMLHSGLVKPQLVWRRGLPLVQLTRPSLRGRQLVVKRSLDIVLSLCLLVALSPLFAVIALFIRLDSKGPIFFRQNRAGYGGRRFRMTKFRTMCVDADAQKAQLAHLNHTADSRLFKIPNDPRVTRVGRLLRKWSLDELPQLIDVLMGQMTLVGPRPFFESDMSSYEEHHFRRLGAKPGITGLWQVSGRSAVIDFEEVVRLDQEYINAWSPWLDLKILMRTLPAVVRRTGAF